jgi:hypothetical protein
MQVHHATKQMHDDMVVSLRWVCVDAIASVQLDGHTASFNTLQLRQTQALMCAKHTKAQYISNPGSSRRECA